MEQGGPGERGEWSGSTSGGTGDVPAGPEPDDHARGHVARSVTENQAALQAARQRYSEGAIDFLNIISAQAQLLQSENDLADSDTQIATDLVNLYRALGGGWEIADAAYGVPGQDIATP